MRTQISAVLYAALALLAAGPLADAQTIPAHKPSANRSRPFLQVRDHQLFLGPLRFRNVGATLPDLFVRFLRGDEADANKALTEAQAVGIRFVRCACLPPSAATYSLFTSDRARWFSAFDRMLAVAASHDIVLVPSLLYDAHTLPQVAAGATPAPQPPNPNPQTPEPLNPSLPQPADMLDPGTGANKLAVAYVTAIVTRYKNDSRILFWEIGNEYNLIAARAAIVPTPNSVDPSLSDRIRAFLSQMAALIHKLDKRHPVTSGNGEVPPYAAQLPHHWQNKHYPPVVQPDPGKQDTFAQYQEMLDFFNPPGIDIISVHEHPPGAEKVDWLLEDDTHALRISWTQYACAALGKPLFVGAFGQQFLAAGTEQPALWTLDFLKRMQLDAAPLAAVQSWEPGAEDVIAQTEAMSPQGTPQLAFAVKVVNATIVNAQANNLTLIDSPPLPVSAKDRERALVNFLRALSGMVGVP